MDRQALEDRLRELEQFKVRVETGQRWLLCAAALLGFVITTATAIWAVLHGK